MCGPPTRDQWPEILAKRLKALAERRAALIAEINAHFGA